MKKTIKLPDGREITYELTRKDVSCINCRAKKDGFIAVSANPSVCIEQIEDFLKRRADFFFRAFEQMKRCADQEKQNSCLAKFLGQEFPVRVIENSREIAVFEENECRVFTKNSDQNNILSLIEKTISERFAVICSQINEEVRVDFTEKGFEPPPARISIKKMKSRWGSCSYYKGHISINSRLAVYPRETIASVFYHEYAHFWHHDHSKRFYDFLLMIYPLYYQHNNVLKQAY